MGSFTEPDLNGSHKITKPRNHETKKLSNLEFENSARRFTEVQHEGIDNMAERIPEKIRLEIVTPERQFFAGEVDSVTIPGLEGYMGILPGHAPLLSELKIGVISYTIAGEEHRLVCGWGFAEVLPDQVSILAEKAETAQEIDVNQARQDKERAEEALRSKLVDTNFQQALELWQEATARLEVAGRG